MSRLAIIPARGGSKRIPRKNIKPFLGKPIIGYAIETALASGTFAEVMVTTDDDEIAEVARSFGAEVPFRRSPTASSDQATTLTALTEVLERYGERNRYFSEVCCIYATSPFVTTDLLHRGLRLLLEREFDSVFPVIRYGHPVQRGLELDTSGKMSLLSPEYVNVRSQDLTPTYHDAGMFYWFRPKPVHASGALWTKNSGCIPISELEAQDIDTEVDWKLAELKYQMLRDEQAAGNLSG